MSKLTVLCCDPSLRNWGLALMVLDESDNFEILEVSVIKTKKVKSKDSVAVTDINTANILLNGILEFIGHRKIDAIALEMPLGSQKAAAMKGYGIVIGLTAALSKLDIPMIYKTPFDIKRVIGNRDTKKEEIIDWVNKKHPNKLSKYKNQAEHQADAVLTGYASLSELRKLK